MKTPPKTRLLLKFGLLTSILLAAAPRLSAEIRYFDLNGSTSGFGVVSGGVYTWNADDEVWNFSSAGTGTDFVEWTAGDIAAFKADGVFGNSSFATIQFASSMTVGGIQQISGGAWTIEAADAETPVSLQLTSGAEIKTAGGVPSNGFHIRDNVNVIGNFIARNGGNYGNGLRITGTGAAYQGTITIEGNNTGSGFSFTIDTNSRIRAEYSDGTLSGSTKFIINSGALYLGAHVTATIKEISGTGGRVLGENGGTLIIDQSENTLWGGAFFSTGNAYTTLTKTGAGRLVLTNAEAVHRIGNTANLNVNEGSLYVAGKISRDGIISTTQYVNIADDAIFGGSATVDKRVRLLASGSVLDPGAYGKAGTMELQYGILADNGGTFHFAMNGDNGAGELLNSQILLTTAGIVTLNGTKEIRFFDLGSGLIKAGVAYTLVDASATGPTLNAGWDQNWTYDLADIGWTVESFGWDDNRLQITFAAIPEPSSLLLGAGAAILCGLYVARKKRSRL